MLFEFFVVRKTMIKTKMGTTMRSHCFCLALVLRRLAAVRSDIWHNGINVVCQSRFQN
jgi:hypothetical protein